MRPTEVTDDQIINAGLQLEATQARVTGFALRREIGAGNPSRLSAVWKAYKEKTAPDPTPQEQALPLPGEIEPALKALTDQMAASLRQLVVTLNAHCQREANARVLQVEQEAAASSAQYLDELADASSQIENLESINVTLERQRQEVANELAAANERIAMLTGELAKAQERLDRAGRELEEARAQEGSAKQAAQTAERTAQQLERDLTAAHHSHAEELGRHKEALAGEHEKRQALEAKLSQAEVTRDALSEQFNTRTLHLTQAEAKIKALEDRMLDQTIRLDEQHSIILSQRSTIAHFEQQCSRQTEQIERLQQELKG